MAKKLTKIIKDNPSLDYMRGKAAKTLLGLQKVELVKDPYDNDEAIFKGRSVSPRPGNSAPPDTDHGIKGEPVMKAGYIVTKEEYKGPAPGTKDWLAAKSKGPKWKYHDARGVENKGYMGKYIDRGGTDHTAYMYHHETGELSLVSGQRLKDMKRTNEDTYREMAKAVNAIEDLELRKEAADQFEKVLLGEGKKKEDGWSITSNRPKPLTYDRPIKSAKNIRKDKAWPAKAKSVKEETIDEDHPFAPDEKLHFGFGKKGGAGFNVHYTKSEGDMVHGRSPTKGVFGYRTFKAHKTKVSKGWAHDTSNEETEIDEAKFTPEKAHGILKTVGIAKGTDFHTLRSSKVDELLGHAKGYSKPASANGSKGRYFHDMLQRKAASVKEDTVEEGKAEVFKSRLSKKAGHSYLDPKDPRGAAEYTKVDTRRPSKSRKLRNKATPGIGEEIQFDEIFGFSKKEKEQKAAKKELRDMNSAAYIKHRISGQKPNQAFMNKYKATKNLAKEETLVESMTRKHFQLVANTVRAIEDPKKRQEMADHHAAIFAQANPRFDHKRFHAAAGTSYHVDESIDHLTAEGKVWDKIKKVGAKAKAVGKAEVQNWKNTDEETMSEAEEGSAAYKKGVKDHYKKLIRYGAKRPMTPTMSATYKRAKEGLKKLTDEETTNEGLLSGIKNVVSKVKEINARPDPDDTPSHDKSGKRINYAKPKVSHDAITGGSMTNARR